jgi:hypothetical protein
MQRSITERLLYANPTISIRVESARAAVPVLTIALPRTGSSAISQLSDSTRPRLESVTKLSLTRRLSGLSEILCKRVVLGVRAVSGGSGRITQHEFAEV